jgi:cobalt-zinc-cadmium efflux system outer membrane protein
MVTRRPRLGLALALVVSLPANAVVPDPSPGGEATLPQLLAYAEQHAPPIHVARAHARRGDAEVLAASPLFQSNPEFTSGFGGRALGTGTYFELQVSVQQTLELAGERFLRLETAERTREVALAEQDESRWLVHVAVHTLFFEALVARERTGAAERVVRFTQDLQQAAQRRVDAGDDAPLAMLVVRADLAQATERLIAAQLEEELARSALAEAAGWPAERPLTLLGALPAVRTPRTASELLRLAAQHTPALRTQALAVTEAEARLRLVDREAWPKPTVGLAYTREGAAAPEPGIGMLTVALPLPLWNRNQGEHARALVTLETARAERDAFDGHLRARLTRAASAVDAAARRVQIYGADVVPAVDRNLELIRRAYDLGEIDIHAVSQTRERVLDTQRRVIDARSEYARALAELEGLVGTELDDAPVPEATP